MLQRAQPIARCRYAALLSLLEPKRGFGSDVRVPLSRCIVLPEESAVGRLAIAERSLNADEENGIVEVYLQFGVDSVWLASIVDLLAQVP
jgi:hypothetical protein